MTPINKVELTEHQVWSAIQYLDPDLQALPLKSLEAKVEREKKNDKVKVHLVAALAAIYVVAILLALGLFRIIALTPSR